ncbi:profilin [Absidia repens]|uniref:Profilin n=1 Tax=Absidia repens TaxID=90262 RepID=A0A1X2IT73_9FUNG|nr:profilin [Absidia repens]
MSWQQYVDNNLVGTGQVSQAAIYGLNGAKWASSPDFELSATEVNAAIAGFADPASVQGTGLHISGVKYLTLRADERSIYVKKSAHGGACLVKTGQAILVGLYKEGMQAGSCTKVVEGLADYLISVGY